MSDPEVSMSLWRVRTKPGTPTPPWKGCDVLTRFTTLMGSTTLVLATAEGTVFIENDPDVVSIAPASDSVYFDTASREVWTVKDGEATYTGGPVR